LSKNIPIGGRFFAATTYAAISFSEYNDDKRYKFRLRRKTNAQLNHIHAFAFLRQQRRNDVTPRCARDDG